MTISVSSKDNSELPDILPAEEASARRPYSVVPRGAITLSSAWRLVSRVAVKRKPVFCLEESIASTVRIKMRVPAGTVILFLVCAAGLAAASCAKPEGEPSPETPGTIAMPTRSVIPQKKVLAIAYSPSPEATNPAQQWAERKRSAGQ